MTRRPRDPRAGDLVKILRGISRETRTRAVPNTTICPADGCLLLKREKCPACALAARPRLCECGARVRRADVDRCHACRKKAPRPKCAGCSKWVRKRGEELCHDCRSLAAPKPQCACGRQVRSPGQTACSTCRHDAQRNTPEEEPNRRPMRWVRKGLIMRAVYEQSEVA